MNNEKQKNEVEKKRDEFIQKRGSLVRESINSRRFELIEKNKTENREKTLQTLNNILTKLGDNQKAIEKIPDVVKVKNFPETQKVEGTVTLKDKNFKIDNFPEKQKVEIINPSKSTKVDNFPEIQKVKIVEQDKEVTVKGLPIGDGKTASIKANPTRYVTVRLTDGQSFIEGLGQIMTAASSGGSIPFVDADGKTKQIKLTADGKLPVEATINVGDIEIGAVEIKDATSDTRVKVGANGMEVDVKASALPSGAATSANQSTQTTLLQGIAGFAVTGYDYIGATYPDTSTEVYTYKTGGSGGTTIATITVVYSDAVTKNIITSVTKT